MEVLFTIGILVIVATLVVPSLRSSYELANMKKQLSETQAFLELASQYSQSLNRRVVVSMNIKENKVQHMEILDDYTKSSLDELAISSTIQLTISPSIDKLWFSPTTSLQGSLLETPLLTSSNISFEYNGNYNGTKNITIFYHSGAIQQL